ncbi:hypothetical protein ACWEP4_32995 [Streptomyces sp. NPDC004227]
MTQVKPGAARLGSGGDGTRAPVIPTIIAAAVTVYAKLLSRLATTLATTADENHETA